MDAKWGVGLLQVDLHSDSSPLNEAREGFSSDETNTTYGRTKTDLCGEIMLEKSS